MREKLKDPQRLAHILEAIDNILTFVDQKTFEDLSNNKMLRFAIIKNLEIIGEASYLLTKEFKSEHSEIPWEDIISMRHLLVHGYYRIKDDIIWKTIDNDLIPLQQQILAITKK